jgi:hypothetical protein
MHRPAPVAVRTGLEGAAEEPGSLGHAEQPEARGRGGVGGAGLTVVPDGEPHAVVVAGDDDMHEGGVACVSERVRDRLLGQAVERRVDRRGQLVEATGQRDVDMGRVTGAAGESLAVGVFGSFVLEDDRVLRMFGLGLAVAVLLDATLIRMLLVPATMALLGARNWWMPRWLDRLVPRLSAEGTGADADADGHGNAPSRNEDKTGAPAPEPQAVDA